MTTQQHHEVLTAAQAALVPSLRRGDRGRRVDARSLGLDEGPLDRGLQTAARSRGLAIFACTDSQRMVNVVSLAGPTERDLRLARPLKMLKTRPRSAGCSFCGLQSIVPAKGKSPLVPVAGTYHRLHADCLPGWKLWAAAAEKHLAARRPSLIPVDAGLVEAVAKVAEQLLGAARGWKGPMYTLWSRASQIGGAGAWARDEDVFKNLLDLRVEGAWGVYHELKTAGLGVWKGDDGAARVVRTTVPEGAQADALVKAWPYPTRCRACGLEDTTESLLNRLRGGGAAHGACAVIWLDIERAASAYRLHQQALADATEQRRLARRARENEAAA